jgi:hypothetical protein
MPCGSDSDCLPKVAPYCDPNARSICTVGLTFAVLSADCSAYGPIGDGGALLGAALGDGGATTGLEASSVSATDATAPGD